MIGKTKFHINIHYFESEFKFSEAIFTHRFYSFRDIRQNYDDSPFFMLINLFIVHTKLKHLFGWSSTFWVEETFYFHRKDTSKYLQ